MCPSTHHLLIETQHTLLTLQTPFGYTRKDVIVLGVGVIAAGFALKYGLEVSSSLAVEVLDCLCFCEVKWAPLDESLLSCM